VSVIGRLFVNRLFFFVHHGGVLLMLPFHDVTVQDLQYHSYACCIFNFVDLKLISMTTDIFKRFYSRGHTLNHLYINWSATLMSIIVRQCGAETHLNTTPIIMVLTMVVLGFGDLTEYQWVYKLLGLFGYIKS
jgi:hypothetical protein